jgi:hypothetical protein
MRRLYTVSAIKRPASDTGAPALVSSQRITEERTYRDLVGPLGRKKAVCAECLFVNPVADIALLGPTGQSGLRQSNTNRMRG